MNTGRPAGDLAAWVEQTRAAAVDDAARARIPADLLFPAPGRPDGHLLMGYDERGWCPMLVEGACSIYDDRPMTCRAFDCRVFAATAVAPDPDKPLIAERAQQWRFGDCDASLRAALRAAADFVRDHRDEPMFSAAVHSPTGHAVLAVEIHDEFLDPIHVPADEILVRLRDRHRTGN